jgi:hypothetical protein
MKVWSLRTEAFQEAVRRNVEVVGAATREASGVFASHGGEQCFVCTRCVNRLYRLHHSPRARRATTTARTSALACRLRAVPQATDQLACIVFPPVIFGREPARLAPRVPLGTVGHPNGRCLGPTVPGDPTGVCRVAGSIMGAVWRASRAATKGTVHLERVFGVDTVVVQHLLIFAHVLSPGSRMTTPSAAIGWRRVGAWLMSGCRSASFPHPVWLVAACRRDEQPVAQIEEHVARRVRRILVREVRREVVPAPSSWTRCSVAPFRHRSSSQRTIAQMLRRVSWRAYGRRP